MTDRTGPRHGRRRAGWLKAGGKAGAGDDPPAVAPAAIGRHKQAMLDCRAMIHD